MKDTKKSSAGCLIVFIIVALLATIGYLLGNNNSTSESIPEDYDWVVGIWTCETPYGIQTYSLGKNGSFSDNSGHEGTFTIENGRIYTHLKGTIGFAIEIDELNRRIGPGEGYWMTKVFN